MFVFSVLACLLFVALASGANTDSPLSTGQYLNIGASDPNWSVSYQGGSPSSSVVAGTTTYWKDFSSYSTWISPPSSISDGVGDFTYSTTFTLTKYDPNHYFLKADVALDDELVGITVNGVKVPLVSACTKDYQYFSCTVAYEFSGSFKSGTNTVSFIVNNVGGAGNPSGLNVNFYI